MATQSSQLGVVDDRRILIWLFIDDLNIYQEEVTIQFGNKGGKKYHLSKTVLHDDILYASITPAQAQLPFNQSQFNIRYRYIIREYKTEVIERQINFFIGKQATIFDTPQQFVSKSILGLNTKVLLSQKQIETSLLKFIQSSISVRQLFNLKSFIIKYGFQNLLERFYEQSIEILQEKLIGSTEYSEPIEEYFVFLDVLTSYSQELKDRYVVVISFAMSRYYFVFKSEIQNYNKIRNKLIDFYASRTSFDQRINILLCDYCVWEEHEAEEMIGKKQFNEIIMQRPLYYIEFFKKNMNKYANLFNLQIQKIVSLIVKDSSDSILLLLQDNKEYLSKLTETELDGIRNSLFDFKSGTYYQQRDKCMTLIKNIKQIQEIFQIPKYQLRNEVLQLIKYLDSNINDKQIYQQLFECMIEYKIDIHNYDFMVQQIFTNVSHDNERFYSRVEEIIEKNPFTSLDKILLNIFTKNTLYYYCEYLPSYLQKKNKYIDFVNRLFEKQRQILYKRQQKIIKKEQEQQVEVNQNSQQTDKKIETQFSDPPVQEEEQKREEPSQWDNDIVTDKQISLNKREQAQPLLMRTKEQQSAQEKKLKDELRRYQRLNYLTEESVKLFKNKLTEKIEKIVSDTPLNELLKKANFASSKQEIRNEFEFMLKNRIQIKVNLENENDDTFFKNYSDTKSCKNKSFAKEKIDEVLICFDNLAIRKVESLFKDILAFEVFESDFILSFLAECDKTQQFFLKVKQYVEQISNGIYNLTPVQFQKLKETKYYQEMFGQFNISVYQFKKIEEYLVQAEQKQKDYKIFFFQFQQFFPEIHESLYSCQMNNYQINQIQSLFASYQQFDLIVDQYISFQQITIFNNILNDLMNTQLMHTYKEIENLKEKKVQLSTEKLTELRYINFTKLMISLINNLYQFSYVVFNCQQNSLCTIDNFNKLISTNLAYYYQQIQQQEQQQQNINQQQKQQQQQQEEDDGNLQLDWLFQLDGAQQQEQKKIIDNYSHNNLLFNNQTSINDLKKYCGDSVEALIFNLRVFHHQMGLQGSFKETENNIKKCYMTVFYLDSGNIIKSVGETLKANWKIEQNQQLMNLLNVVQKYKDMKNFPIQEMIKVEISQQVLIDFEVFLKLENVNRNMDFFIQSQAIIQHSKQNKEKNISYLDMRDFIGDNDHDLSSLLTVMNEFSQFFTDLADLQTQIVKSEKSVITGIVELNGLIQARIQSDQQILQWEEIIKNFIKISSIESSIDKKKSYLTLLKKMYSHGKTTMRISKNKQESTFEIECDGKHYTELEIREISSRVLIEKHSINAIFEQEQSKNNQNPQNISNPNTNNRPQNQEQKMEDFKRQLELSQDLQNIIQEMIKYGYFLFEKDEYIYNNQNNKYNSNMEQMRQQLKKFEADLVDWRREIDNIIQQYPKFSFICHSYYSILDSFLSSQSDDIYQSNVYRSIWQIVKFQIQSSSFDPNFIQLAKENYSQCSNQQKLQFLAYFVTQNQTVPQDGGMTRLQEKRIRLIQYSNIKEAMYHLLSLNQQPSNLKTQFYLFCDETTCIQDIQLFIQRYKYLNGENPMSFFLILNSPQQNNHIIELLNLQSDKPYLNYLFILIHRDYYDERLCQIQQHQLIDVQQANIQRLKQQLNAQQMTNCAQFYTSTQPGAGKTEFIFKQSQECKGYKFVRIPTNGDGDKKKFTLQMMKNIGDCDDNSKRVFHIDVYESSKVELNFILFEMIVLKSLNYNSQFFQHLGADSIILVEINNTLRRSLEQQLCIKDYFEQVNIEFNINNICLSSLTRNYEKQSLYVYKYLKCMNNAAQTNNNLYFDDIDTIQYLSTISTINQPEFALLLDYYIVQHLISQQIVPNFWQISNFISLFGKEMEKMEQCIYLKHELVERAQLRLGLRTTVIQKSFELCRKVSISCLQNTFVNNDSISNEQLLTNKAQSLILFSSFMQDFVTFQEQEEACVTSFFQRKETTPQSIQDMYKQYQLKLLLFDQEQSPQVLIHWLTMLCNKHIQRFYSDSKDIAFDKILNPELRSEVEKIIIQKDNFFKIAMIFLRIRSQTPIIIMGEAGIGKTALIRLLSLIMEANFKTKIIHAGVTEDEVIQFIEQSEEELKRNQTPYQRTVLFFDEVNTNTLVSGLFKEVIVDRYLKGRKLNPNIVPIAALNPYKLKSEEQQKIMQIQIHGGIKKDIVNKIQGSDLEYTVNPIPDSMYSFSWNYGGLQKDDEISYIIQILHQMNDELKIYTKTFVEATLSELVFFSQQFVRSVMGRISACSLRDVKRFVNILKNNINFIRVCIELETDKSKKLDIDEANIQYLAVYLSFYINYCVRIPLNEKRNQYLSNLTNKFTQYSNELMRNHFEKVEKFLINQIDVPIGIAKNYSLRQNAFILFISIINKIPVCLIGPPGSSKTLSLRQLIQSMQGVNSRSNLFKKYPALMPLYYQGHIQSTSERIMEVFDNALKKQQTFNSKNLGDQNLSLVYIDEIGLAEISPHNPLKVLHATLEKPDISVACISNWPLDASKMNRMLTVYRMDTNEVQLIETFQSIFEEIQHQQKDPYIKTQLEKSLLIDQTVQRKIANIYLKYIESLKLHDKKYEQFHGPRDFFSACKLICSEEINSIQSQNKVFNTSSLVPTNQLYDRITKAFYRHFSGLQATQQLLEKQFAAQQIQYSYKFRPTELIEENLKEEPKFFISRHLMVISDEIQNATLFLKQKLYHRPHQFFIGSDFPEDTKMQACYNVINKIVSCIENGMIVILQNLDNIYQSLYEVLNQSYRYYNGKYFCKISFGAESSNIEVSKDFKLILLVNQNQIHRMDGPLLNRFEKHLLLDSMILSEQDSHNIKIFTDTFQQCRNFEDLKTLGYTLLPKDVISKLHPFFRFKNVQSVIQNFYLQLKLQKQQSQEDQVAAIDNQDQHLLFKRIFQLLDFFQIYLKSNMNAINEYKDAYIKSGFHYSINDFIQNRILLPKMDYVTSESKYFYKNKRESQVRQLAVISPQSFIPDAQTSIYETIQLNSIPSEQELLKKISNFLNKGVPIQDIQLNKKSVSTYQDCSHLEGQQKQSYRNSSHYGVFSEEKKQEILFVIGDMSVQGNDQFERIVFTIQKIDEAVDQYLSTVLDETGNQDYKIQLNVILLLKVDEEFTMIPVGGRWEYFYLENLTPFYQFKNDQLDYQEQQIYEEIKKNLSLSSLLNKRTITIQNLINVDALIIFYLQSDQQIFSQSYQNIQYQQSEEMNIYQYKQNRLEMITKIFSKDSLYKQTYIPLLTKMVLIILKQRYKIELLDDLVFSYLMPKGLTAQSSSLHTCIMNGLKEMLIKSLYTLIYHLENKGLIYGMVRCEVHQFVQFAKQQIELASDNSNLVREQNFKPLKMQRELIISESEEIMKVLQSLQVSIKHLKESVMINVDDLFSTTYKTAKQNLIGYHVHLSLFSEQILEDFQNVICPQDLLDIQIVKSILLIMKKEYKQQRSIGDDDEDNTVKIREEINLKDYKQQTDIIIPIYILLFLMKDKIVELRELIKFYTPYINFDTITTQYINQYADQNISLSESINQFNSFLILMIYDNIKPMSSVVQQQKLLNYYYPKLTKPFIEYLIKNNQDKHHQKYKDLLTIINIICTEFTDILEVKNLLDNFNFDRIMSLNFKEVIERRKQFYNFFGDFYNRQSKINSMMPNTDFELLFIQKWNNFLRELIITATEQDYIIGFDINFVKILLQIELDELRMNNNTLSNEFKIFLNRVFKSIRKKLTIENTQKSFNISSHDLFSDENGKPYHTEYYTFVIYGEAIQQNVYQYTLNNKANENIEFLYILVESNFEELSPIQKVIYLSIYKEFIHQLIHASNIQESLLFQKIEQSNQSNPSEIKQINEQFIQSVNSLDTSLQRFFQQQKCLPLQAYVAKLIIYSKKNIDDFTKTSFYLKNIPWLKQFSNYTFKQLYNKNTVRQDNYLQKLEEIIVKQVNNQHTLFQDVYKGLLKQDSYYPFNMINQIQSQIDFYDVQKGDEQLSLYQCVHCLNYVVVNNANINNQTNCSCCENLMHFNNKNSTTLIQQGLENKVNLQQLITRKTGFCLQLNSKNPQNSIKSCKPEYLRIFSLLYYMTLNLSLKNTLNNPLNQTINIQYANVDPLTNNRQPQQYLITLINKILNIPIKASPYEYITNQIQIAYSQLLSIMEQQQFDHESVMVILENSFAFILNSSIQQHTDYSQIELIENDLNYEMESIIYSVESQQISKQAISLLKEDFKGLNPMSQNYLGLYPKSLRINTNMFNSYRALLHLTQNKNNQEESYSLLINCLNVDFIKQISKTLHTFITFYYKMTTYFSNQFEFSQVNQLTVKQALIQIGKEKYDNFESFYQEKFVPCWNELINWLKSSKQVISFNINDIQIINDDTKLINLIFSTKNQISQYYKLVSYLVLQQNTFIENLISFCLKYTQSTPSIQKLQHEIWFQFIDSQNNKIEFGLQDIDPLQNIIKEPNLELIEKFACYGLEEGDCIYENIIIDKSNLQTELIKQIFKNSKYINLVKSLQFQYLPSFYEFIQQDSMIIPQENIQGGLQENLKAVLNSKDIAYDTLQKMTTIYSFFKLSPAQHSETSLYVAMKQLNIRVTIKKLETCLQDHLKLKHLKSFISLLEELNMNNLVQLCNPMYKDLNALDQQEQNLFSYIWQSKDLVNIFKTIIGRFIIRLLSLETATMDPNLLFVNIITSGDFNFDSEKEVFSNYQLYPFISTIKISRCYHIYESICFYQNQQQNLSQGQNTQKESNKLFIENFTDSNAKKNIRQLINNES